MGKVLHKLEKAQEGDKREEAFFQDPLHSLVHAHVTASGPGGNIHFGHM